MLAMVMPCRLLLNISSIDPQTHLTGAFEALCVYPGDKIAISTPGKYSNHPCYKPIQNQPNYKQLKSNFMRRLLLLVCLTLALAVPAMADEVTYAFSALGASNIDDLTSTTTTIKNGDVEVATITYGSGCKYYSADPGTLRLYNGNYINVVAADGININSFKFTTTKGSLASDKVDAGTWTPSTATWTPKDNEKGFKFTHQSNVVQISSVTINYTAGSAKQPSGLSFGENATATAYLGATEPNVDLPTLANPNGLVVTYESEKTEVADIDSEGIVTPKTAGTTKITASTIGNDTFSAGSVSYVLEVIDAKNSTVSGGYVQVTTENSNLLKNGAKVIIGSIEDGGKGVGNDNTNRKNFPAKDITITDGVISTISAEIAIFELGYDEAKGYSLKITNSVNSSNNGQFLYAGSTGSNQLKLSTDICYADITINQEGNAVIKFKNQNTRNILRYNTNSGQSSGPLFSCYSSGQKDVQIYVEQAGEAYEAPAAVDATFEGNTSLEGENLYIVAGENVTVTLPVPEGVLAYYYINDDATMIRYTAPFEVSAGDIVGYYTEQYGLKSEEKMFEVKGIDFSGIAPELKGFNGEHAVMVSFDLTGFDGSVWYKFNDAAAAAPALVTPAEEGYTEYAEPFKIAAVGTLTYKAESHGLMSAPVEKSITGEDLTTGVENVVVSDDSEAAYYDLNGRRVTNPAAGIYIRIAGGKATKAIIR